jgi:hypothetical protein
VPGADAEHGDVGGVAKMLDEYDATARSERAAQLSEQFVALSPVANFVGREHEENRVESVVCDRKARFIGNVGGRCWVSASCAS